MILGKMCEMNENTLDRHFVSQLRIMCDVYSNNISKSDIVISQRWLQVFHKASRRDKYARNCLMLLMYGQLREMGKLGMPFVKAGNVSRSLGEVLCEYQGNLELEEDQQQEQELTHKQEHQGWMQRKEHQQSEPEDRLELMQQQLDIQELQLDVQDNENVASEISSYNGSLSDQERLRGGSQSIHLADSNFELLTQKNQQLIQEINQMHARTVENEQRYRQADTEWQQRMLEGHQPQSKQRMQWLLRRIDRGTELAIRQLKNWATNSGPLNFLYVSLQHILDDDPETRKHLSELDRRLETVLDSMLEQAGERREKNVRMLYDQLFKQQQESLSCKQQLLQHELALTQARQQLQVHVQDLKQREQMFWEQVVALPCFTNPSNGSSCNTEKESAPFETLRSTKTQTNPDTFDDGSSSRTDSGICGCPDCQAELEQQSSQTILMETYVRRSCQYCKPQRPKDDDSSSKR